MHHVVGKLQEGDYVRFNKTAACSYDQILLCCYVDDRYAYLRHVTADTVNHRASLLTGEMRVFISDSWLKVDGMFRHYIE